MYYKPRSSRRSRSVDYVMPFLIIISVGVILILVFNLWRSIFSPGPSADAFMHIKQGSVQVKAWNTDEYFDLSSDAVVISGDEVRTSADAQVIVEFFDGTIMRMGGGADVLFENVSDSDDVISLLLVDGKIWFNKLYKDVGDTEVTVSMDNIIVNSISGSIFELENEFEEVIRVLNGDNVSVDVKSMEDSKVIETETVGVGQEIVFTDKVLERYWQYQSPSVLSALSDEFKDSPWYVWNIEEDQSPTEFVKGISQNNNGLVSVDPEVKDSEVVEGEKVFEPEVVEGGDGEEVVEEEVVEEVESEEVVVEEEVEEELVLGPLKKPTITSVAGVTEKNAEGFYVVEGRLATLTGTISGAEKVVVNNYTLTQFEAGDNSWTYFANADFALMVEGENIYEVYALSPDGTRSDSIYVKVLHDPAASVVDVPVVVEEDPVVAESEEVDPEVEPQF